MRLHTESHFRAPVIVSTTDRHRQYVPASQTLRVRLRPLFRFRVVQNWSGYEVPFVGEVLGSGSRLSRY